jgi:RHS repeat-associated protein
VLYDGLNNYWYNAEGQLCAVYQSGGSVTTYLYDGEGRICAVKSEPVSGTYIMMGYVYDAEGARVAKGTLDWTGQGTATWNTACSGITGQGGWTFTLTTSWVLGQGGEQVTELAVSGTTSTWAHTNIFAGDRIEATYHDTGTYFYLADWLGTKRAEVGANGCVANFASLPFGDGLTPVSVPGYSLCPDATEHHFTGKERDTETGEANGNDYFGARYYASSMGRFMSPDWSAKVEPVPYSKLDDPQSLNLYAYMLNNPLGGVDPDGHCGVGPGDPCTASQQACIDMGKCDPGSLKAQQTDTQAQQQSQTIANAAANQEGSGTYEYQNRKGTFPAGTNKCNEFVADTVASTGAPKPQVPRSGILGWLGFTRDPTAKEWATMSIKGWSAPDSVANARPGDVIAVGHTHDAEGHVGIVVSPGWTASANSRTTPAGIITVNNWGFRSAGYNDEGGGTVVVRHYLGGDQ